MQQPTTDDRPCLLATGAIERDNFGDLLYAVLLAERLPEWALSFGAPIAPAVSPLDAEVANWSTLLDSQDFAAAWVVGGEVGATPPEYAYLTTHGMDARRRLAHASLEESRAALTEAMGGRVLDPPYIPRPSAFPRNADIALVINSVGLAGIAREPGWRQPRLIAALREADVVSVRDRASSAYLDELGIRHTLAPDFAHTVAIERPRPRDTAGPVLVHLSEHALHQHDAEGWAAALLAAVPDAGVPLRMFTAGLAPGHDSTASAESIADALLRLSPGRDVTVSPASGIWDRVDEIAASRLWVGASLHGRIIASAYGVPRVSLAKPKVDAYAADWDAEQPYGATIDTLPDAVAAALAAESAPRDDLARQALENFTVVAGALDAAVAGDRGAAVRSRLAACRQEADDAALVAQRASAEIRLAAERVERQRALVDAAAKRTDTIKSELDAIRASRRWQLFESMDRAKTRLRLP
jgi:hypothetical protein